jgi:hypothetical protein
MVQDEDMDMSGGMMSKGEWTEASLRQPILILSIKLHLVTQQCMLVHQNGHMHLWTPPTLIGETLHYSGYQFFGDQQDKLSFQIFYLFLMSAGSVGAGDVVVTTNQKEMTFQVECRNKSQSIPVSSR